MILSLRAPVATTGTLFLFWRHDGRRQQAASWGWVWSNDGALTQTQSTVKEDRTGLHPESLQPSRPADQYSSLDCLSLHQIVCNYTYWELLIHSGRMYGPKSRPRKFWVQLETLISFFWSSLRHHLCRLFIGWDMCSLRSLPSVPHGHAPPFKSQ